MKVILTIHHFPPHYSAGAEIYVFRLASWLIKHGYDVEVVCVETITHNGDSDIEHIHEIFEGVSVWRLYFNLENADDPFKQSYDNPLIGNWFENFLRQQRPDVVHINSCYLLSASTVAAVKQLSLPLVITLHDFWFICPRITLLKPTNAVCTVPDDPAECAWCLATSQRRFRIPEVISGGRAGKVALPALKQKQSARVLGIHPDSQGIAQRRKRLKKALNQADLILAPSEFLRKTFIDQGTDPAKIIHSRYGLDISHWVAAPQPSSHPADDKTLKIGYIGQIALHKGVHLLIKAVNQLNVSKKQVQLQICGDLTVFPDYVAQLKSLAQEKTYSRFSGRYDNKLVAQILAGFDVIVVPSIWYENSPIAIMEALTAGTPVVTSNLGGMPELVQHNSNGLLFNPNDVDDLTKQLQRLLDEPDLAINLAKNAHPIRMIDDEMQQLTQIYDQLLKTNTHVY